MKLPNSIAAANTRKRNTSTAVSTKSINAHQRKRRHVSANTSINIRSTDAKRVYCPPWEPLTGRLTMPPLLLRTQMWMTGLC